VTAEIENETPTLAEVIDAIITKRLRNLFTSMPGKVIEYTATIQRATVQPLVKHSYFDENGERKTKLFPPIAGVPVFFFGNNTGHRITFPINKGDTALLMFSYNSMDTWLSRGDISEPGDDRMHSISDAIALVGLRPFKGATQVKQDALVIQTSDEIRLGSDTSSDDVARKSDLDALRAWLVDHTHTGGGGGPVLKPPSTPAVPTPVGTNLKVD